VVLGSHEFGLRVSLGAPGGCLICTGREDYAGGSAALLTLSEYLENQLADFEVEDATLNSNYVLRVVEIVIGGVPPVLEVRFMCLCISLGRILIQHSVSTNLFNRLKHQVDLSKVDGSL
jgi:hypothetical protein